MINYNVDCEITVHYGLVVTAHSEEEAQQLAEVVLEAKVEKIKNKMTDYEISIGDIDRAES